MKLLAIILSSRNIQVFFSLRVVQLLVVSSVLVIIETLYTINNMKNVATFSDPSVQQTEAIDKLVGAAAAQAA